MSPKKNRRVALGEDGAPGPLNTPFANLGTVYAGLCAPSDDLDDAHVSAQDAGLAEGCPLDVALKNMRRPHVFKSRKGRGGKTVTEINRLETIEGDLLMLLCTRLRKSLGCGGSVEGSAIMLQGDQVEGVATFFAKACKDKASKNK